jgi:hypothetical protein
MRRLLGGRVSVSIAVAIGVLAAAVGGAVAATRGGSVHACAKRSNGALRLANHCKRGEKGVAWSIRGPQGSQGPQGLTGPQGPRGVQGAPGTTGERGPSDAFTEYWGDVSVPESAATPFTLGAVTLPAGNFMVFGKASVNNGLDQSRNVTCGLGTPGIDSAGHLDNATDEGHIQLASGAEQTITLLGPVELSDSGDVSLDCYQGGTGATTGSLTFTDIEVSAIEVGSLNFP